ncbi:MAG: NYN domain-containing protein [Coleofasciculaceae cyanobacterium]
MVLAHPNWLRQVTHKRQWLNLAETTSLISAGLGLIAATALQQVAYYSVPTTALLLLNYRRINQLDERNNNSTTTQLRQYVANQLSTISAQVEQLNSRSIQEEQISLSLLSEQSLAPIFSELEKLKQQAISPTQSEIATFAKIPEAIEDLQEQLTQIKQQLAEIESKGESVHNQNSKINQRLAVLDDKLETPAKCETLRNPALLAKPQRTANLDLSDSHPRGRVAIFIDSANLEHAARQLGIKINYKKLLELLKADSPLVTAQLYIGVDPANYKQKSFFSSLRLMGYEIAGKPIIQRADGSRKANVDMELGLGMLSLVGSYDTAILVSGDADYTCVVKNIKDKGASVEVVSLLATTGYRLMEATDVHIDLESIKEKISWQPRPLENCQ